MDQFTQISQEISNLISIWETKLSGLSEAIITKRRNEQNRNIKQIVGHMVDSAINNTSRIVHLQYGENPSHFPDYANLGNNDRWIAIQNYEAEDWHTLIQIWKYTHIHVTHIIKYIDQSKLGNIWISALNQEISLKAMVIDFPRHFTLHLNEIETLIKNDNL